MILLHDASVEGCLLHHRLRNQLVEAKVEVSHFIDLGLTPGQGQALDLWAEPAEAAAGDREQLVAAGLSPAEVAFLLDEKRRIGLAALTPNALAGWFEARLREVGLAAKALPAPEIVQQRGLERLREKLGWHIEALFHEVTGLPALQDRIRLRLQERHHLTRMDFASRVSKYLTGNPDVSWEQALDRTTDEVCRDILRGDELEVIREQVAEHHTRKRI